MPASRVTLVGDAAHTHGGSFAAGGSLALDDSRALGLAFKHVFAASGSSFSQENIQQALALYDQTRRPHTARLLSIVHSLMNRKAPTFATPEEEDEALITRMKSRPDLLWLSEHDVEKAFQQVVAESKQRNLESQGTTRATQSYQKAESAVASPTFGSKL